MSIKRINLPLIGVDLLIIKGQTSIQHACNSGDLHRVNDVVEGDFNQLPWIIKMLLPTTRFYSEEFHCHHTPNRAENGELYDISMRFINMKYKPKSIDFSIAVKETVFALMSEPENPTKQEIADTDAKIGEIAARAFCTPLLPPGVDIPDEVLEACKHQLDTSDIAQSFLPHRNKSARESNRCVFKYIHDNVVAKNNLPSEMVVEISLPLLSSFVVPKVIVRAVKSNPHASIEEVFGYVAATKSVMRMSKVDTTLNGLLDKPIKAKKTLVMLDLRSASRPRKDLAFAFGTGSDARRCPLEHTHVEYFEAVRQEYLKQKKQWF